MFIFNNISTCFGHHYAHLQENKTYYCMWCAALVLLDVVGSGCGALRCGCEHCEGYSSTVRTVT